MRKVSAAPSSSVPHVNADLMTFVLTKETPAGKPKCYDKSRHDQCGPHDTCPPGWVCRRLPHLTSALMTTDSAFSCSSIHSPKVFSPSDVKPEVCLVEK